MITGAHAIIYTTDAEADRRFFRDVIGLPNVDAGGGWLIFKLPPTEAAFHPSSDNGRHEFYLMCEDIELFIEKMKAHDVECSSPHDEPWGRLIDVTLPGGGKLGVYEPHHERPG